MNKKELVARIARGASISQAKSLEIVNLVFDPTDGLIARELVQGYKVVIPGFGTFSTRLSPPRLGTNPNTGGKIELPEKRRVRFHSGKTLKEHVAAS